MKNKDQFRPNGSSAVVWDIGAASYETVRSGDAIYHSCFRQTVASVPGRPVLCLDAGCGTGFVTALLAPKCDYLAAVDYSAASLHILRSKGIRNLSTFHSDIRSLPFEDNIFDVAVCANTLQHLTAGESQRKAIAELRRVTREGGHLIVSVHHYSREKKRSGWTKEGKPGQPEIDYIFRFTRRELAELMPRAAIRGIGYGSLSKIPFLGSRMQDIAGTLLGRLAARLGHGHMLLAIERNDAKLGS